MKIGRRIYYDKINGNPLVNTGERMGFNEGDVIETTLEEDFISHPSLHGRSLINTGFIELEYGERYSEFINLGSYHVDIATSKLIIYPHFTVEQDKTEIQADGINNATITVQTAGNENVIFTVDGVEYTRTPIDGVCTFTVDSDLPSTITVTITSVKYGQAVVTIEVI